MPIDWSRVVFTEHMKEAAAVEAQCQVVLDFGPEERACYEITVLRSLADDATQPFFAYGRNLGDASGCRPVGEGPSPEEALQECLAEAGLYHRRRLKQATS